MFMLKVLYVFFFKYIIWIVGAISHWMYHTSGLNKIYNDYCTKGVFWALNISILITFF